MPPTAPGQPPSAADDRSAAPTPAPDAEATRSRSPSPAPNDTGAPPARAAAAATNTPMREPSPENDTPPPLTLPITRPARGRQGAERGIELPAPTGWHANEALTVVDRHGVAHRLVLRRGRDPGGRSPILTSPLSVRPRCSTWSRTRRFPRHASSPVIPTARCATCRRCFSPGYPAVLLAFRFRLFMRARGLSLRTSRAPSRAATLPDSGGA